MNLADYETLVAQLAVEIRRYLVSRGADPETAADIVQDMFVKVLESDLVLPPEKLRPYLYRVAWSTYLDAYRRRQRYRQLVDRYLGPALQRPPAPSAPPTVA
ncbi:RNA polymerase sigma factor, partial [Levilactobacillus namurensis]